MCVKTVVIMRISDRTRRTDTITLETMFINGRFTQGPRTSLSLHKSRRKTVALGSSTPASAWTPVVINPRGALGMSTIGRHYDHSGEGPVEELRFAPPTVKGVPNSEHVTECVRGR